MVLAIVSEGASSGEVGVSGDEARVLGSGFSGVGVGSRRTPVDLRGMRVRRTGCTRMGCIRRTGEPVGDLLQVGLDDTLNPKGRNPSGFLQ